MKFGKSIRGALSYNERKVGNGKAELILSSGFSCDTENLSFSQKLARFEKLTKRQEKPGINTLHLSLNFSPGEVLSKEKLQLIAQDYMDQIGFGRQPYLAYQHKDTSHPHIHIVSTTVKENGKSFYLHNIAKNKSEPARKAIEIEYNLVRAEDQKKVIEANNARDPSSSKKIDESETKRKISNKVEEIVSTYKFSNLDEFNAALKYFDITADPGKPGSRTNLNSGLVYYFLDAEDYKTGIGIKASSIFSKPTYKSLENKFRLNAIRKIKYSHYLKNQINRAVPKVSNHSELKDLLKSKGISVQFYLPSDRFSPVPFLLDLKTKSVFSPADLGINPNLFIHNNDFFPRGMKNSPRIESKQSGIQNEPSTPLLPGIISALLAPTSQSSGLGQGLTQKKKKKKKRRSI